MSTVKSKKLQVGTDATATNNFTIYQPSTPDGTLRIGVGNADSPTEVGQFNNNGYVNTTAPVFRAYSTVNQTGIAATTLTKILFDTEEYDIGGNFASSRFTAPIDGYYHFSATTHIVGANGVPQINLLVNGALKAYGNIVYVATNNVSPNLATTVYLAAGDYAEAAGFSTNATYFYGGSQLTWFSGFLVRAA
jgi:hypothetical protein